jgi:two-component system cell cycle sensor histidine kinase/response regulator CckA
LRSNATFSRLTEEQGKAGGATAHGRLLAASIAERDRTAVDAAIENAAAGKGDTASFEVALAGEDNRAARFFVAAVEQDEHDAEAAIIFAIETTDQRALQAQLAQAQKMDSVGQLAGGIAHDFNNVLSAIMMATDFLLNAHRPTDPSFQDIMQIKQNANRAASLVRQLLAFSRRQTMRPQVLDLGEVLNDLSMLLRRLIGEKVTLEVAHGRDLWPVKVDISQLEQVIVNLAVNARDAMPDGGKVSVRTADVSAGECARYGQPTLQAADYVLIEVADSGTGIAPEIMDKIFEPFFTTKEVGKGTGLGLSTVYGIVKQMGGFIYADSGLGRGTTFRIFLPRHAAGVTAAPEETVAAPTLVPDAAPAKPAVDLTGRGTILLVEDEEGLRGLNARGLASRGYTVLEAANGVEAIRVLEEHNGEIDLVVSDVVMPEMDGPTLLKEMRKDNPDLKMIFVSGYAEEAFEKNLPGGQFTFLAKPFTLKQLVATVKDTMAG